VPARVLKDENAEPNICLNCGSLIRANLDKDGLELCNNPNDVFDQNTRINSLFDLFKGAGDGSSGGGDAFGSSGGGDVFGGPAGGDPFNNIFGGEGGGGGGGKDAPNADSKKSQQRRESTIIDVDAKKDDE